jgi:hypothetical protein
MMGVWPFHTFQKTRFYAFLKYTIYKYMIFMLECRTWKMIILNINVWLVSNEHLKMEKGGIVLGLFKAFCQIHYCSVTNLYILRMHRTLFSFIGGGNRSTWRKPPTCRKLLTNYYKNVYYNILHKLIMVKICFFQW